MKVENIKTTELELPKGGLLVRQAGKADGIEQLAANIAAFGLIQPLLVTRAGAGKTKKARYVVIDGGRRLAALKLLDKPPAA
ncbi:MAG TPA: ParB N-terminal domain-containing protein, partial [Dongiaceae bacterium]|nr:ParB N-terminal domain-containing protein [Dongiaceae bacterium]